MLFLVWVLFHFGYFVILITLTEKLVTVIELMLIDISIVLYSFGLYSSTSDSTSDSLHPLRPAGGLRSLGVILKIDKRSELRKDRNPHVATIKFTNISESWKKLVNGQLMVKFGKSLLLWTDWNWRTRKKLSRKARTDKLNPLGFNPIVTSIKFLL